jgi:single-stranded DNA-binding protein
MSANNQTLIIKKGKKYYVFSNVTAESWTDEKGKHKNEISIEESFDNFDSFENAFRCAARIDGNDPTEYGVQFNQLQKDGAKVKIVK